MKIINIIRIAFYSHFIINIPISMLTSNKSLPFWLYILIGVLWVLMLLVVIDAAKKLINPPKPYDVYLIHLNNGRFIKCLRDDNLKTTPVILDRIVTISPDEIRNIRTFEIE